MNNVIEKFKKQWRRLGLSKTWYVILPIVIILPIAMYFEWTIYGLLLFIGVLAYFLFIRKGRF